MSDSTCCICMESLTEGQGGGIGAIVPCGHCLHHDCFRQWEAHNTSGGRNAKCPMCNEPSKCFVKLFIDLSAVPEDDEDSSSDEESDMGDEEEEDLVSAAVSDNIDSSAEERTGNDKSEENPEQDIIEILDDDEPTPQTSPEDFKDDVEALEKDSPTKVRKRRKEAEQDDENKYRRKSKRYKRRFKQLQSKQKQLLDNHRKILEKHESFKEELEEQRDQAKKLEGDKSKWVLERNDLRVEMAATKRELQVANDLLLNTERELDQTRRELDDIQSSHREELERSNARNMSEVKRLLEENPKLVMENKELKDQVSRLKQVVFHKKKRERSPQNLPVVRDKFDMEEQLSSREKPKSKKQMSSILRQVSDAQEAASTTSRQEEGVPEPAPPSYTGKRSAHSDRMSRAAEKKNSRKVNAARDIASHKPFLSLVLSKKRGRAYNERDHENNKNFSRKKTKVVKPLAINNNLLKPKTDIRHHFFK